jgi:excisionase family DNA binding protein
MGGPGSGRRPGIEGPRGANDRTRARRAAGLLSLREAADDLGVTRWFVERLIRDGKLTAVPGAFTYVRKDDLERFKQEKPEQAKPTRRHIPATRVAQVLGYRDVSAVQRAMSTLKVGSYRYVLKQNVVKFVNATPPFSFEKERIFSELGIVETKAA